MSHIISPYDRKDDGGGSRTVFIAIAISVALHIGALVGFLALSGLHNIRIKPDNVIYLQLGDSISSAAAAPKSLPVDPDQTGPDVVEAPRSAPELPAQVAPEATEPLTAPTDVIPLGPKNPEKPPEIKKTQKEPPKPTPPKVEPPKPKPKPKPKQNLDDDIAKKMAALKRKVEADEAADDDVDSRMWNINRSSGRGEGEGSESSGLTRGERVDPAERRYYEHIRDIITYNWLPLDAGSETIKAAYRISIQPDGSVSSSKLVQSSGSEAFDLSVERAVKKSSPFPPLPPVFGNQAIGIVLEFTPGQLRRNKQ